MSIVNTKGVDISYANGNIDLAKVKNAGFEFVMIRCGFGSDIKSQDDSQFENNVKKAESIGLPWGVYLYSYATNASEAKSEVEHIKRLLKGKKPTMPIAIDIEDAKYYKKYNCYNKSALTAIAKIIVDGIKSNGYYPMIYTSYSWLDTYLDKSVYTSCDLWVAQWHNRCQYKGSNLGIWQYGGETNVLESNSISGVGVIDKNICYKDYPTIIKNGGYNGFKKSTSTTTPAKTTATRKSITEAELRQKVANTINAWLGATEGNAGHKEILKIYNAQNPLPVGYKMKDNDAWCAATVSATWLKVGIAQYITTECGCGRFRDNAKKLGIWVENDAYKPKVGDAIIYYWSDNGVGDCQTGADHIGLITAVNGNSFTVTEGNTDNGVVGKRTMQVNGRYIRGFITPDYATIAKKVAGKVTADSSTSTQTSTLTAYPNVKYRVRAGGKWWGEITNLTDYAGVRGTAITDVAIKATNGTIKYRVHVKGGSWLSWITDYNVNNSATGYAGNGKPIDAIEVYYYTPNDIKNKNGYLRAKYRVSPISKDYYDWQYDNETTNRQDGYAGAFGRTIDRLQITLAK